VPSCSCCVKSESPFLLPPPHHRKMSVTCDTQKTRDVFDDDAIKGLRGRTPVSELFFSDKNFEAIQHGIRYGVYAKTCGKHVIGNQSTEQLIIIMRSIFLQHTRNLPYNIVEQVKELNSHVLEFAIDTIVKELDMYEAYTRDASKLPVPMERSVNVSSKGDRIIEFKSFM